MRRRRRDLLSTEPQRCHDNGEHSHSNGLSLLNTYKVTVVNTIEECEQFLKKRISSQVRVVGLDCEWRGPSYLSQNRSVSERTTVDCPVALLQLAFPSGEVVLIRLCSMRGIGPILKNLLSDRRYVETLYSHNIILIYYIYHHKTYPSIYPVLSCASHKKNLLNTLFVHSYSDEVMISFCDILFL